MGLLKKATMGTSYAKIGILGFNKSGKTYTAGLIAKGLADRIKNNKVAFFDTEKGSDFLIRPMEDAGIEFYVHKGRAFKDLIEYMKELEKSDVRILIIDSITHIWRDLCDSYQVSQKRRFLEMRDWGVLKKQWSEFTDAYINSSIHILMLGRAGDVYETEKDDVTGKNTMVKAGTKMRVEAETGFEPDLLIEMERSWEDGKHVNKAYIVGDRSNTINGKVFVMPTFKSFESFFNYINLGGEHKGVDIQRTSKDIFSNPDYSAAELQRRREIALEEIEAICIKAGIAGTSADAKKKKVEVFEKIFKTSSWIAISSMRAMDLEGKLKELSIYLGLDQGEPEPPKVDTESLIQ